jgi:hypothetical protein
MNVDISMPSQKNATVLGGCSNKLPMEAKLMKE